MILLAKDQEGYVNLMQTVSEAAVQGFYYNPRVTLDNLRRHAKGMICTSACIAGIIPKYIDRGDMEGAIKSARPSATPSTRRLLHRDPGTRHYHR